MKQTELGVKQIFVAAAVWHEMVKFLSFLKILLVFGQFLKA